LWSPAGWSADRRGPGRFRNGRKVRKPSTNGSPSVLIEFNLPMPKPRKKWSAAGIRFPVGKKRKAPPKRGNVHPGRKRITAVLRLAAQ
jgi:hypothetical protein